MAKDKSVKVCGCPWDVCSHRSDCRLKRRGGVMTKSLPVHRAVLDEGGLRELLKGKVVRLRTADDHLVELILSDIGFDRLVFALADAVKPEGS